jgi:hypothetical protein
LATAGMLVLPCALAPVSTKRKSAVVTPTPAGTTAGPREPAAVSS